MTNSKRVNSDSLNNEIINAEIMNTEIVNQYSEQYLIETLGLRRILSSHLEVKQTERIIEIFVQNLNDYNYEEKELLQKMILAMKIDLNLIKVSDLNMNNAKASECQISFEMVDDIKSPYHQTYSPRVLLKQSKLKNEAWAFLQRVMQKYQTSS